MTPIGSAKYFGSTKQVKRPHLRRADDHDSTRDPRPRTIIRVTAFYVAPQLLGFAMVYRTAHRRLGEAGIESPCRLILRSVTP